MERPPHAVGILSSAVVLGCGGLAAAWAVRILPRHGPIASLGSVRALEGLAVPKYASFTLALTLALILVALVRAPALRTPRAAKTAVMCVVLCFAAPFFSTVGHHGLILGVAAFAAAILSFALPRPKTREPRSAPRWWWLVLWAGVAAVHAVYSIHRHRAFGSGSWDHGCMVHNFYRASRFLSTTSTVLGEVDFLGDHFMIGIYLYAPLMWIASGPITVLLIQAVNVGAAAPAVYLIGRNKGMSASHASVLAIATGLGFGLQSAAFFDSHELTVGFGFLAFGLVFFESKRLWLATLFFALFALFKESIGAYLVGLGLLAAWRGLRDRDRRQLYFGAGWIFGGALWFVLVNRIFMPALTARSPNKPEPHETFGDFGPTVFEAVRGIVTSPIKAFAALFVPEDKLLSHAVLFSGLGGLAIVGLDVVIAALPLFAERFLSSKGTMWEMGYHYAAPLTLYAGWAAALGWQRVLGALEALLARLDPELAPRAARLLPLYVLAAALLTTGVGYKAPSNYWTWNLVYFAKGERALQQHAAIALLRDLGRDPKLAVQDRMLPHLADRPYIYRLGEQEKADYVLFTIGAQSWPYDEGLPLRLAQKLVADPSWRLVFSQGTTLIFARVSATALPAVPLAATVKL